VITVTAIVLIAVYAIFIWDKGVFHIKNGLLLLMGLMATVAGVWDAWRVRHGALHYAAGQWVLAKDEAETQGTLQVVMDLQYYILARFIPLDNVLDASFAQQQLHPQWLHLESRHGQDWRALRRALFAAPSLAVAPSAVKPV
jgi:hypothetical protein